jgi:hypothetical protein
MPTSNHFLHLLDYAGVCLASFSVMLSNPPLTWVGRPDRKRARDASLKRCPVRQAAAAEIASL